jgi:hypothetical protein
MDARKMADLQRVQLARHLSRQLVLQPPEEQGGAASHAVALSPGVTPTPPSPATTTSDTAVLPSPSMKANSNTKPMGQAPPLVRARDDELDEVVAAARTALEQLGPTATLRELRLHLELVLGRSLDEWKAVLKETAEEYATEYATANSTAISTAISPATAAAAHVAQAAQTAHTHAHAHAGAAAVAKAAESTISSFKTRRALEKANKELLRKRRQSVGSGSFFDMALRSGPSRQASSRMERASVGQEGDESLASVEARVSTALEGKGRSWWVIDPRVNKRIAYWDGLTMVALVFTALVTPFEVSFVEPPPVAERWGSSLFLINRLVDLVFIADIALQFCLGYSAGGGDSGVGKYWELDPKDIAVHYVTSKWFYIDIGSVAVSGFDIFCNDEAASLSGFRAVRVLRLFKLVRLLRTSRVFKRWEMRVSIDYTRLSLAVTCTLIVLCCHWFSCLWGLQASFNRRQSWLSATGYCTVAAEGALDTLEVEALLVGCTEGKQCHKSDCNPVDGGGAGAAGNTAAGAVGSDGTRSGGIMCGAVLQCENAGMIYAYSLYWSVMTITSVGYGDVAASAFNAPEQIICTLMMLASGILWSHLIGTFCGLAASLAPGVKEFRELISGLNAFMVAHNLPPKMRFKLREYMHESAHLMRSRRETQVLGYLSRQMHAEVSWFVHRVWLERVWYLRTSKSDLSSDADSMRNLLLDLSCCLRAAVFPPGEKCNAGLMYIISRGIALHGVRVRRTGMVWGEDILLAHPKLQSHLPAMAMSYIWAYTLDGTSLFSVLNAHPRSAKKVFRHRMWWLLRRFVVRIAELALAIEHWEQDGDDGSFRKRSLPRPIHDQLSLKEAVAKFHEEDPAPALAAISPGPGSFVPFAQSPRASTYGGSPGYRGRGGARPGARPPGPAHSGQHGAQPGPAPPPPGRAAGQWHGQQPSASAAKSRLEQKKALVEMLQQEIAEEEAALDARSW